MQQIIDKDGPTKTLPVLAVLLLSYGCVQSFIDTTNRIDISLGELVIDHLLDFPCPTDEDIDDIIQLEELEQIRSFLIDTIFSTLYVLSSFL